MATRHEHAEALEFDGVAANGAAWRLHVSIGELFTVFVLDFYYR